MIDENILNESQSIENESSQQAEIKEAQIQESRSTDQEINFAKLRDENKRLQRERDELVNFMKQNQLDQKPKEEQQDQEYNIAPDDIVEGKHLSKYDREINALKKQLKNYQEQSVLSTAEVKLKNKYPDFDTVVNSNTVALLRETYPELASTINSTSDLYTKGSSAYTLIKRLGIYKDDSFDKEKETTIANVHKPRPVRSISPQEGDGPLSRANAFAEGLTDELREQLRKEMSSARRGY